VIRNVIIKVTHACNLNCRYCYVRRTRELRSNDRVMSLDTLEALIKKTAAYIRSTAELKRFVYYWHGGEPLLAGPSFYRAIEALQQRYLPQGIEVVNTIQTNGTLLDEEWIALLEALDYGLCLSLDGPQDIHDARRVDKDGQGTHNRVINALSLLKKSKIGLSVLAVITPESLGRGHEVYSYLRSLGVTWMDFMYPFCNRIDNTMDQSIEPRRWGEFLSQVFDSWIDEGDPGIYVRILHDLCMLLLGGRTSMCASSVDCSYVITIDPVGRVFICDDLLSYSDSMLGNVHNDTLADIEQNPKLRRLASQRTLIGEDCRQCDYFDFCKGGCTLFRVRSPDDFSGRHYFCDAQRLLIEHVHSRLREMSREGNRRLD